MAPRRRDQQEAPDPDEQEQSRRRPSLIQRLSGLLASIPRRTSREVRRPITALGLARDAGALQRTEDGEDVRAPLIRAPPPAEAPCPYDPRILQSFPSIERQRCWNCGLPFTRPRNRSGEALLTPCDACRARSPNSHLAMNTRYPGNRRATSNTGALVRFSDVDTNSTTRSQTYVPQVLLESRPRPLRISRLPPLDSLFIPSPPFRPSTGRPPTRRRIGPDDEGNSALDRIKGKFPRVHSRTPSADIPQSPKLHHIHGLPKAKDYPYVHRREVEQHLAAIRAGAPSPIRDLEIEAERVRTTLNTSGVTDWSNTVYYPHGRRPVPPRPSRTPTPEGLRPPSRNGDRPLTNHVNGPTQDTPGRRTLHLNTGPPLWPALPPNATLGTIEVTGTVAVRENSSGNVESGLDSRRVHTLRSPRPRHTPSPLRNEITRTSSSSSGSSTFSTGTMPPTPDEVGGRRPELRGGHGSPWMRGGGREECVCKTSSMEDCGKKCCRTWEHRGRSRARWSDGEPLARVVTPERVARASKSDQRVPLPRDLYKYGQKLIIDDYQEFVKGNSQSQSSIPTSDSNITPPLPPHNHPLPNLRGGGHPDPLYIPPKLFHLSGGRGHPITIASWNRQKPAKRLGGLLGLAIYGHKAGTPYRNRNDGVDKESPILSEKEGVVFTLPTSKSPSSPASSSSCLGSFGVGRGDGGVASTDKAVVEPSNMSVDTSIHTNDATTCAAPEQLIPPIQKEDDTAAAAPEDTRSLPVIGPSGANTPAREPTSSPSADPNLTDPAINNSNTSSENGGESKLPEKTPTMDDATPAVGAAHSSAQTNIPPNPDDIPQNQQSGKDTPPPTAEGEGAGDSLHKAEISSGPQNAGDDIYGPDTVVNADLNVANNTTLRTPSLASKNDVGNEANIAGDASSRGEDVLDATTTATKSSDPTTRVQIDIPPDDERAKVGTSSQTAV